VGDEKREELNRSHARQFARPHVKGERGSRETESNRGAGVKALNEDPKGSEDKSGADHGKSITKKKQETGKGEDNDLGIVGAIMANEQGPKREALVSRMGKEQGRKRFKNRWQIQNKGGALKKPAKGE